MINSTWLIFGGLGITAIVALAIGSSNSSSFASTSDYNSNANNNAGYNPLPDYTNDKNYENTQQPVGSYNDYDYRNEMQAYGGKRRRKTKKSKKSKKSTKRVKK
jgi:hypothetical protein